MSNDEAVTKDLIGTLEEDISDNLRTTAERQLRAVRAARDEVKTLISSER